MFLESATTSRADFSSKSCSCALGTAGSSWLLWLCCPSPWGAPFKGLPGPTSARTLHQTCLPPVQCVLNSSGKGLGSAKSGHDGSVCPHPCQNHSQWQGPVSAAMSVGTAQADHIFPPSPPSPTKNKFLPKAVTVLQEVCLI